MRSRLVPVVLAALLGLGVAACEVEEGVPGDPLLDDPGFEEPMEEFDE